LEVGIFYAEALRFAVIASAALVCGNVISAGYQAFAVDGLGTGGREILVRFRRFSAGFGSRRALLILLLLPQRANSLGYLFVPLLPKQMLFLA
jgi:hypothetical protein